MIRYCIPLSTFWAGSYDHWFGPGPTREVAFDARDRGQTVRSDLGQDPDDMQGQTRILGVHSAIEAEALGRRGNNTLPAMDRIPGDREALVELSEKDEPLD